MLDVDIYLAVLSVCVSNFTQMLFVANDVSETKIKERLSE